MKTAVIILAAGQGTRTRRQHPKVLLELAGRPLLHHVLATAQALAPDQIHLVCGHGNDAVRAAARQAADALVFHEQTEQLGTAHAVACADAALDAARVVVLYGDVPLLRAETARLLLQELEDAALAVLTARLDEPSGYGRILRDGDGQIAGIVEEKDAADEQRRIKEVSTGTLAARGPELRQLLQQIDRDNAQGEFYLTDCVELARSAGMTVGSCRLDGMSEALGVNTLRELEAAERRFQAAQAARLMAQGCRITDASRLDVRGSLRVGADAWIDVNVLIEGEVVLGDGVHVGANCVLKDASLGAGTEVRPFSIVESSTVGRRCVIGPFARIRPDTELADEARIGNFVEVKNSKIGPRSKISHLSYVGDSSVGRETNLGAGTITCNYDGADKHRTVIGDDVFVGSGTQLVAPVTVADGATIGAGSTITRDAAAGQLTLTRSEQKTLSGWQRPKERRKK